MGAGMDGRGTGMGKEETLNFTERMYKKMKKILKDIFVFALLMAAMIVFCGFEGKVVLCAPPLTEEYPFELYMQSEECDVLETSSQEAPSFKVSIPRGKAATLKVNGAIREAFSGGMEIKVSESGLPQGVTCSEVKITSSGSLNSSATDYAYAFSINIPASLEGDFDLTLKNANGDIGDISIITAAIRINRIGDQPKTGDSSCAALWITLLCMSGAALLMLRRREHN